MVQSHSIQLTTCSLSSNVSTLMTGLYQTGRELLGSSVYLSTCTCPEIAHAVPVASCLVHGPAPHHWSLLKRIVRYLKATKDLRLRYNTEASSELQSWTDANHGADPVTRQSVTGWAFRLAGAAADWQSKRQPTTAILSTEAEYLTISSGICGAIYLCSVLSSLGLPLSSPTPIRVDSCSTVILTNNPSCLR